MTAPGPVIRAAGPGDVADIVAVVESAYRAQGDRRGWTTEADLVGGRRTHPDEVTATLDRPGARLLVTVRAGRVLGCCRVEYRPPDGAELGLFAVDPGAQGSGIGRSLVAAAEELAGRTWGARWMRLRVISVRHELLEWYGRRGYRATGETEAFDEHAPGVVVLRAGLRFAVLEKALVPPDPRRPDPVT